MKTILLWMVMAFLGSASLSFLVAQDIDLTGYTLAFDDEFNTLSISAANPKGSANWFAGPVNGATGDFSSSNWNIDAFSIANGILSDQAWFAQPAINSQNWQSGLISSVDPNVTGFNQLYGYFEIRCQMPNAGEGAWPAFWLDSISGITHQQNEEIDVFEWYGVTNTPGNYQSLIQQASHNWNADGSQNKTLSYLYSPETSMPGGAFPWNGYHIYGCQIDPVHITWYIDGVQTNQIATPTAYVATPFYVMVDYALGGGWDLSGSPFTTDGSSSLLVDWVRVYSLPLSGVSPPPASGANSIGLQFQGGGAALLASDTAGLSAVAQSNWNVLTGSSFSNHGLVDSSGAVTALTLGGSASGSYSETGSSAPPAGNAKLASGELISPWPAAQSLSVSNIPYSNYDVYLYAGIDAPGRSETIALTPGTGAAQYQSFTTEAGGSAWTPATNTWNGSGNQPSLPTANYAHYSGLTAASFTLNWGAPGNGGLNGIQIVPNATVATSPPAITTQPAGLALNSGGSGTLSVVATGTSPLIYQWYLGSAAISGATGSAYTISSATSANAGNYDVVITNAYGTVTSAIATVTVPDPSLIGVASVQLHAGTPYSIALPLSGKSGVESRVVNGSLQLVFSFDQNMTSGAAAVTTGTGSVNGNPTFSGNTMTVTLTGVDDGQNLTVEVSSLNGTGEWFASTLGILVGDANGDGAVNSRDLVAARDLLGIRAGDPEFNPSVDINEDGAISSQDLVQIRNNIGHRLP